MIITLTGATGLLGRALLPRLLAAGHQLRLLSRTAQTGLPPGVELYIWDAARAEPPPGSLQGAEAVIHLAGESVAQRWTAAVKKRISASRLDSTRLLVQGISSLTERPKILLSASAIGYYGDRADETLTESSSPGPGFLGDLSAEWEAQANLARALGLRVNLLRTGIVLSPRGGALAQMLPPFRMGVGGRLGEGQQWMSWIHVQDWAGLVLWLLDASRASGPVNLVSPNPVRNAEFSTVLGRVLKRPALLPVPRFVLQTLFGEMSTILLASQRVQPAFAENDGYHFVFPSLEPALRDLLQ
jgi:uncharacterized protein (TIGR01777 family)